MIKCVILDEANADIEVARQYYRDTKFKSLLTKEIVTEESEENDLSLAFYAEVKRVAALICANPYMATEVEKNYYRRHLKRFPYKYIYYATEKEVLILALQHNHMHPDQWKNR